MSNATVRSWWERQRRWLMPLLVAVLFLAVLRILEGEAAHLRYHDVMEAFRAIPARQLALALLSTVLAYAALPGYDAAALAYAGHRLPLRRIAFGSVITYGISQTLGFPALTGGSLRVRLWSAWGLETPEIARAAAFAGATFTFGVVLLTGLAALAEPSSTLERLHLAVIPVRILGAVALAVAVAYVGWSIWWRGRSVRLGQLEIAVPGPRFVAAQVAVAITDWTLAALVLFVLLPAGHGVSFTAFLALFLLAQTAGIVSHVPGGVGVFETLMVLQLGGTMSTETILGSLLAYRVIFYLVPFVVALILLSLHEFRRQRGRLARTASFVAGSYARWGEPLLPAAVGVMTIVGGVILLVSGATPAVRGRITALVDVFPLGVIELSHFAGSIAGAALVVLGWALTRRLDAAWHLARVLIVVGIAASLLKGLDYEEALALAVVFGILSVSRNAFYRPSSLLSEPLTPEWGAAIALIVGVCVWVGFFSFKHVEFTNDLWWRFAARADAPRFLRASAGAAAFLGAAAVIRLLRPAVPLLPAATPDALARVAAALPHLADTAAALSLLGDKQLLFADDGNGFLMYGVSGRSWIALGDPFGTEVEQRELAWRFREMADRHAGWPVFYEVSAHHLPIYIDLGLTLLKMGEEAMVPLTDFSLDGGARKGLRRTRNDLVRAGARVEIVGAERIPELLPTLRAISDDWLSAKATREKGFSLGRFDPEYLARFPHALVFVGDRIVAFANLWTGNGTELSVDLMRYVSDAPHGVMEYLFIEMMLWGRDHGFSRMSLGMAPLSGLDGNALAPRWHRFGGLLYRHGEHFYNFRGLRTYKEKFDPRWEPRYLATPAGLALPRILANVAALISGGITGLVGK